MMTANVDLGLPCGVLRDLHFLNLDTQQSSCWQLETPGLEKGECLAQQQNYQEAELDSHPGLASSQPPPASEAPAHALHPLLWVHPPASESRIVTRGSAVNAMLPVNGQKQISRTQIYQITLRTAIEIVRVHACGYGVCFDR